ncbi:hypothetical protein JIX56_27240 [Streptomyces sp. CA-210063]|uniref:hypothetical protein n=1 Tax=Streptomyces sp. CA-210063 TaxID=2801029 RepID=UPI00214CC142|nr:hypothetical protein [Streptomyces sp. CA-210063]UUU33257.1 hypothetical protein JIX56_27240 [Streptomyces sp. CA-210063]
MLAVIVTESLKDPALLRKVPGIELKRYTLPLDDGPVEIIELDIPRQATQEACLQLAAALRPERYYAHLQDAHVMYVVFPHTISVVRRSDPASEAAAQRVGALFSVPLAQMNFLEMFTTTRPGISTPW